MYAWQDRWIDGSIDGWTVGWLDSRMDGCLKIMCLSMAHCKKVGPRKTDLELVPSLLPRTSVFRIPGLLRSKVMGSLSSYGGWSTSGHGALTKPLQQSVKLQTTTAGTKQKLTHLGHGRDYSRFRV